MRRHARLIGAAACYRSPRIRGFCSTCGQRAIVMHMPIRRPGKFCPEHCPACRGQATMPTAAHHEAQDGPGEGG